MCGGERMTVAVFMKKCFFCKYPHWTDQECVKDKVINKVGGRRKGRSSHKDRFKSKDERLSRW